MKRFLHAICLFLNTLIILLMPGSPAFAETEVSGIISGNTTWTSANSPYIVTGNIQVKETVSLTIEKNTVVKFRSGPLSTIGYYIQVDGTLIAEGAVNESILFTSENKSGYWGCIAFTDISEDWDSGASSGSIIRNCIIEYAGNSQGSGNSRYGGASIKCFSAVPLIKDNIIRYSQGDGIYTNYDSTTYSGGAVTSDVHTIQNNRIHHTTNGVNIIVNGVKLENNYFIYNSRAINFSTNLNTINVLHNTIINDLSEATGNCLNIPFYFKAGGFVDNTISITGNEIINNLENSIAIGIAESDSQADYRFNLTGNNIHGADVFTAIFLYNWKHTNPAQIDMTANWWGTVSESEIDAMIYDYSNDFELPEIDYSQYLGSAISDAGSTLSYPPIADAGGTQVVTGGTKITLDGSGSYDPDDKMIYAWVQIEPADPLVEITGADNKTATFSAPYVDVNNKMKFQLTVTDPNGFSDTDDVTVNIDENIANAGPDQFVGADSQVRLDGSNTYDPAQTMTYAWTQIGGPAVTLETPNHIIASFYAPYSSEGNNVLVFRLYVSNANGLESTDDVIVTVNDPETVERKKGDCFISSLSGSLSQGKSMPGFKHALAGFFGVLIIILCKNAFRLKGQTRKPYVNFFLQVMVIILLTPGVGLAGYFSIGNGAGGDADEYSLSIETGAVRLGGGNLNYLLGGGVLGMFHGYNDFPSNTRDYPCPHKDYVRIDKVTEGVESGLYGKAGIGLFDTDVYVSVLAGISMVTEIELVQSNLSDLYYEQSSDQKFFGIYGGGISYFPDLFRWEFCLQLDYDNRRGIIGSVGFHW
ncbi:MAG: right-handed parallel beta-helix repeat-containing protein [Proteobacteria bacterium]|nr:right-handed parallel beta-helix repeat-containing protein [Pseudomonadota bacterium]